MGGLDGLGWWQEGRVVAIQGCPDGLSDRLAAGERRWLPIVAATAWRWPARRSGGLARLAAGRIATAARLADHALAQGTMLVYRTV